MSHKQSEEVNKINAKEETGLSTANFLLDYLEIAASFRNNEFNIQMVRNAIFGGMQAVLLGFYAATISQYSLPALIVAIAGFIFSLLWRRYFRSSVYWVRFWENKCREVNDQVVTTLSLKVDIFAGHPAGTDQKEPPLCKYGGEIVKFPGHVHDILLLIPIVFCLLWFCLAIAAGIKIS